MIRLTFFQIIRTEEEKIQELKAKYLKQPQILISNYEIRRHLSWPRAKTYQGMNT